eukprot:NODE_12_length_54577_cov_0.384100.p19 type:complete len:306 gc:universal NODE_12_length_54577_cov_0.384100:5319-6236(+)
MLLSRYLWLWTTEDIVGNVAKTQEFVKNCKDYNVKNVFMFMAPSRYDALADGLKLLISNLNRANIKSWSLDGRRSYLSDSDGPEALLTGVKNMLKYNENAADDEKFVGFQTDLEIVDIDGYKPTFHNALGDSELDKNSGGVWKDSQAADREALVEDWLNTHDLIKAELKSTGVLLGAAIPSWWDAYYGDPISATYKGEYQDIFKHVSNIADEIHFMAYNTDPENVKGRIDSKLQFLSESTKVKACAGLETNEGNGETVSYGDNPEKNSRTAMMRDIANLENLLKGYSAFSGVCIHDFDGFMSLGN